MTTKLNRANKPVLLTVLAAFTVMSAHLAHRQLLEKPRPQNTLVKDTLPSIAALKLLSLGYANLTADYYWLSALHHFGDKRMHQHLYPNAEPLIRRVVALDPKFASAYIFAGTALTITGMDMRTSVELLRLGTKNRPDLWKIHLLFGFNLYFFLGDYGEASRAIAKAATLDGAPAYLPKLVSRLAAEAGDPTVGLDLIDTLSASSNDTTLKESFEGPKRKLMTLHFINQLNDAARRYTQTMGAPPKKLSDLVEARILREIPPELLGGQWQMDAQGHVTSTSDFSDIKLPPEARGTGQ